MTTPGTLTDHPPKMEPPGQSQEAMEGIAGLIANLENHLRIVRQNFDFWRDVEKGCREQMTHAKDKMGAEALRMELVEKLLAELEHEGLSALPL